MIKKKKNKEKIRKTQKTAQIDYVFISFAVILTVFGFIMLSSASSDIGARLFGDSAFYIKKQFFHFLIFGLLGFFAGLYIPYGWLKKIAVPFFITSLTLLILVFIPSVGITAKGASRWVNIAGFTFQPGEIMKLSIIIFFSAWFAGNKDRVRSLTKGFIPFIIILTCVVTLFFLQPATTIALIIVSASIIIYFINGLPFKYVFVIIGGTLLILSGLIFTSDYRMERIKGFFTHITQESNKDFERGEGFQLRKTLFAIKSGGIMGVGFGNSATKTSIPEVTGDAIFSVIAEEFGFLGSFSLIFLFGALTWRGFWIARRISDNFGKSLVIGFVSIIAIQSMVNIGAISGFFPITGVPLPFISYGGTALGVFLTMVGIIGNISRYRR